MAICRRRDASGSGVGRIEVKVTFLNLWEAIAMYEYAVAEFIEPRPRSYCVAPPPRIRLNFFRFIRGGCGGSSAGRGA